MLHSGLEAPAPRYARNGECCDQKERYRALDAKSDAKGSHGNYLSSNEPYPSIQPFEKRPPAVMYFT